MRPAQLAIALLALLGALFLQACSLGERDEVLILVRGDDPTSRAIGEYYAEARRIPLNRILSLPLSGVPAGHPIDRATFEAEIAAPIESYLAANDLDKEVTTLVSTLGIPLRMGHCEPDLPHYPRDCRSSAVDAALAGLGRLSLDAFTAKDAPRSGPLEGNPNPYFGDSRPFEKYRRDEPNSKLRFLVARLSGPATPSTPDSKLPIAIRKLIDGDEAPATVTSPTWQIIANAPRPSRDAISRALIDPIHDLLARNGHRVCDDCADSREPPIGVILQRDLAGIASTIAPDRLAFPGLVIALGRLTSETASFPRALDFWLSRGARAISTHLDDPSLGGVTRPAAQLRAWTKGRTAVEAHFNSVPHLGWTNVFIGDPLLTTPHPSKSESGDLDNDGIEDDEDNCLEVANPAQRDSNEDGIGNRCDPDVNNDGRVDTSWGKIYPVDQRGDLESIALTARNGPFDPDHDLDGDGLVDDRDLALAQLWLFRRPGPSGRH